MFNKNEIKTEYLRIFKNKNKNNSKNYNIFFSRVLFNQTDS